MPQTTQMTTDQFLGTPSQDQPMPAPVDTNSALDTPSAIPDNSNLPATGFRSSEEARAILQRMKTDGKMTIDDRDKDKILSDLENGATVNINGVEDKPSKKAVTMTSEQFLGTPSPKVDKPNDTLQAAKGTLLNTLVGLQDVQSMSGDLIARVFHTITQKTNPGRPMTPDESVIAKNLGYGDKKWGSTSDLSAEEIKNAARANPEVPGMLNKWGKEIGGETGDYLSNLNNAFRNVADNSIPTWLSKINPAQKEKVRYAQVQSILASSQMLSHPEGHTKEQLDAAMQVMKQYKEDAAKNQQSTLDTVKEMGTAIKEHPGQAAAGLTNSLTADPELMVAPIATAGRIGTAMEGAGMAARTAAKAGAGAAEGAAINTAAYAAQEAGNPEGNITAGGLKSNAAVGGVIGGVLGALAPNHVAPKVKERIGPPEGPIPKNPIPDLHPDTGAYVKPVPNAQKARFAELQAISKGTPDTQVIGPDGKPVTVPGSKGRILTPEEKAEYGSLKKTVPAAATEARQRALNTALDKYGEAMAKGDAEALEAANESIGRLNSADPAISDAEAAAVNRANKPRVKVGPDGKPIETTPAKTAPSPQTKTEGAPTLPSTLSKANPTYFFGNKRFAPEFANDVDKAAYIIAGKKPSKADGQFLKFVMDATGLDEPSARAYGTQVRASMKQYALGNTGGRMPVPDHFSRLADATPAGAAGSSAAPTPDVIPPNLGSGSRGAQAGRVDPELLKSLAVHSGLVAAGATAGAIAYPDHKKAGAIIGGLAGLGAGAITHMGTRLQGGDRTIPAGQRGIIGGVEGASKDPVKVSARAQAEDMLAKNATPEDVWKATGWYLDKDNSWKWEIPDQHASINRQGIYDGVVEGRTLKLPELLDHDKLSESYPDIAKDTKVKFERLPKARRGQVENDGTITLNSDLNTFKDGIDGGPDSILGTILHEVTHKVQDQEGHARGGNPDAATALPHYEEAINNELARLKKRGIDPDNLTMAQLDAISKQLGHQTYLRLKGEVEARSVQRRMKMTDGERAAKSPEETQHRDVPRDEQIVSYDGQNAASIVDDMQARKDALDKAKESHALLVKAAEGSDNPDAAAILKQSSADIKAKEKALDELRSSKNSMPEPTPVRDTLDLPNQDAIIEGVKAGDHRSQAALYNHFAPILKKYASSFANTIKENGSQLPLDPGELAHVALTKGLQHIDMYKGDSALGTWLVSILRNEALGELRKGESRIKPTSIFSGNPNESGAAAELSSKSLGGGEISEGTGGSGLKPGIEKKLSTDETPESNLSSKQTQKILSRTFANMGEDQKKAMEDFYFNDKSVKDIARDAGVPGNTALSWLSRGRDKVKAAIERDNIAYKGVYNPITGKQGGFIDPKLAIEMGKKLAIAGVGATLGMSMADDDHKLGGALKGAGLALLVGAISPRAAVDGIRNAMKPGKRVTMSALGDAHEVEISRASRYIAQVKYQIEQLVPNAASRERITRYLDGEKLPLSPTEMKAANMAKQFFDQVGKLGTEAGVLKDTVENYVTHLWGKTKENQSIIDALLEGKQKGLSTESNFALKRVFPTIKAGEKAGLTPRTLDVSSILGIYGDSIVKAIANKRLLAGLRSTDIPGSKDVKLMMPSSDAPKDFVSMNHPQLFGLRVHPDLVGPLHHYFEAKGPNELSSAIQGINMAAKRMNVSFSAFHIKALFDAMLGAAKNPFAAVQTLYTLARGNNKALHELLHGGVGDKTDLALQGGLKVQMRKGASVDDDVSMQFYEGLNAVGKLADRMFPGMGKIFKGVEKVNRFADVVMWEKVHAAMKLQVFSGRFDSMKANLARYADKHPDFKMPSDVDIAKQVASFTNDSFGGLNWRRITDSVQSHWGHELAQAAFSPKGRRAMQLMLFAPDWTISTARSAFKAFGKGTGIGGVIHPRNVVDLHRNYLLRSAIMYSVVADTINMQMSGHHFWENEDPTTIDMGDGRTMQWSKHSMESVHWFTKTQQQALNKLGIVPKELLAQLLGVEYLSAHGEAPPMDSHIMHLLENFVPITGQSANDPAGAVSSFFGMPIHGKKDNDGKFKVTHSSKSGKKFK